jgi:hypothetical protein
MSKCERNLEVFFFFFAEYEIKLKLYAYGIIFCQVGFEFLCSSRVFDLLIKNVYYDEWTRENKTTFLAMSWS